MKTFEKYWEDNKVTFNIIKNGMFFKLAIPDVEDLIVYNKKAVLVNIQVPDGKFTRIVTSKNTDTYRYIKERTKYVWCKLVVLAFDLPGNRRRYHQFIFFPTDNIKEIVRKYYEKSFDKVYIHQQILYV